jgi:ribonuclease HII
LNPPQAKKGVSMVFEPWEKEYGHPSRPVAGVDEVGRGCLAGPVVAAAVVLPLERSGLDSVKHSWLLEVQDSKRLTPAVRERLAPRIRAWAAAFAVGEASVEEIDQLNIHHATHLAMRRALDGLSLPPGFALIDGNRVPSGLKQPGLAVVKGDLRVLSIACASILAKVARDAQLIALAEEYPGYGLEVHKGYPTALHSQALDKLGASPIHRRSFGPVARALGLGTAQ